MEINAELLNLAMENVARERFQRELREAIIYGPKILGDVFGEYERLMGKEPDPVNKEQSYGEFLDEFMEKNKNSAPR